MQQPSPGSRISFNGHSGTVRYAGAVDGTVGTWLGVEWDDPQRGKHDGVKDGKRYFTCRRDQYIALWTNSNSTSSIQSLPQAGSFLRPSSNIKTGVTFLEAIRTKYLEDLHGTGTQETVILGSSSGAIEVEAVNLDKIRNKLSRLDKLRDISLDGTLFAYSDPSAQIKETCPSIRSLDLSLSLVCNWEDIANISRGLLFLQRLSLSRNRLFPPTNATGSFERIIELELNDTHLSWPDVRTIINQMPRLVSLEVSFNEFASLGTDPSSTTYSPHSNLQTLNLDNNALTDWQDILQGIACFPSLTKLVLTSNRIETIPTATHGASFNVRYLSLASNLVASWTDLEHVSAWCPKVETLSLGDNPIMGAHHARSQAIAYFPTLRVLDGTAISTRERTDSELLYLGDAAKSLQENPGLSTPFHWEELCEKHGKPQSIVVRDEDKLGSRLVALTLRLVDGEPTKHMSLSSDGVLELSVLPTMALRSLRGKVKKAAGQRSKKVLLWTRMSDGSYVELDPTDDSRTVDWIGLDNGSEMAYQLK